MPDYLDTITTYDLLKAVLNEWAISDEDTLDEFGDGIGDFAFDQFDDQEDVL